MLCPCVGFEIGLKKHHAVHMVWLNHIFVDAHYSKMMGYLLPTRRCDLSNWVQPHHLINDLAEQAHPAVRAEGDEIAARGAVVPTLQAHRLSARWLIHVKLVPLLSGRPRGAAPTTHYGIFLVEVGAGPASLSDVTSLGSSNTSASPVSRPEIR